MSYDGHSTKRQRIEDDGRGVSIYVYFGVQRSLQIFALIKGSVGMLYDAFLYCHVFSRQAIIVLFLFAPWLLSPATVDWSSHPIYLCRDCYRLMKSNLCVKVNIVT